MGLIVIPERDGRLMRSANAICVIAKGGAHAAPSRAIHWGAGFWRSTQCHSGASALFIKGVTCPALASAAAAPYCI